LVYHGADLSNNSFENGDESPHEMDRETYERLLGLFDPYDDIDDEPESHLPALPALPATRSDQHVPVEQDFDTAPTHHGELSIFRPISPPERVSRPLPKPDEDFTAYLLSVTNNKTPDVVHEITSKPRRGRIAAAVAVVALALSGGVYAYENAQTQNTSSTPTPKATKTPEPTPTATASPDTQGNIPKGTVIPPNPDVTTRPSGGAVPRHFFWANVWGYSHTAAHGNKPWGMDGRKRMNIMAEYIEQSHADYGVFNEFEKPQKAQFLKVTDGRFGIVDAGLGAHNAVFYRKKSFHLAPPKSGQSFYKNVYFNGQWLREPLAHLIDNVSGVETDVLAIHNPANTARFHRQEKWRDKATNIQSSVIKRLMSEYAVKYPGQIPRLIIGGDSNEHGGEFSCRLMNRNNLVSSMGNSCVQARKAPIDEVLLSKGLRLSKRHVYTGQKVRTTTDHARLYTAVITDSPDNTIHKSKPAAPPEGTTLPSTEKAWLQDVNEALTDAQPYLRQRIARGAGKLAINLDIDNTSLTTFYHKGHAVPGTLSIAKYANAHDVRVNFNTGRRDTQRAAMRRMLEKAGFPVNEICGREAGENLVHSKQRCRTKFVREGQTIIANIGNSDTDFTGGNYEHAFKLPNYGGKLK
jgi:hypothetical protein